jgi:hypothetical protein
MWNMAFIKHALWRMSRVKFRPAAIKAPTTVDSSKGALMLIFLTYRDNGITGCREHSCEFDGPVNAYLNTCRDRSPEAPLILTKRDPPATVRTPQRTIAVPAVFRSPPVTKSLCMTQEKI